MTAFKYRYRVDQVPWYWWLPMQLYGWSLGLPMYLYMQMIRYTCRVEYRGFPIDPDDNYIFCYWHTHIMEFNSLDARRRPFTNFMHPLWYMYPGYIAMMLIGTRKQVLGSSGHEGKAATEELVRYLKQGDSTFFNPDGPDGPPGRVHKGAIHVALLSDTPLLGLAFEVSHCVRLRGWDRKVLPLPFSKMTVHCGEAFKPDPENLDEAAERLVRDMTAPAEPQH